MTTAKVAKMCGRNYITIEQNKKYCEYGQKRLEETEIVIGNIERAVFDIKPPKVKLVDMILLDYIKKNEEIYLLKDNKKDNKKLVIPETLPRAVIHENGKITFGETLNVDIHVGAALLLGGNREKVNGFDYWNVLRNGVLISIDEIRKKYREEVLNFKEENYG